MNNGPVLTYVDQAEKKLHNYILSIPYEDVSRVNEILGAVDKKVIAGCKASNDICDKILGVHLMLTRIMEARGEQKRKEATLPVLFVPPEHNAKPDANPVNPLEGAE